MIKALYPPSASGGVTGAEGGGQDGQIRPELHTIQFLPVLWLPAGPRLPPPYARLQTFVQDLCRLHGQMAANK
jgi:hypothetical protein